MFLTPPRPPDAQQSLYHLNAPIKDYAWGSTHLLAQLTGTKPSKTPQAEMWFGTHPATPTLLDDGTPLANMVDLPFLVKFLAAAQPLSIQVHPTRTQAEHGYAAEQAAGIALDDPRRTYRDTNHKPEMLVALSDFTALVGFRTPQDSAQDFRRLAHPLEPGLLRTELLYLAQQLTANRVEHVLHRLVDDNVPVRQCVHEFSSMFANLNLTRDDDQVLRNAANILEHHTKDPGVLVALLMNHIQLAPGQAVFVPSGTIHAYMSGLGLEVMATSDNVIRGGLTVKHIDVQELHKVVNVTPQAPPLVQSTVEHDDGVSVSRFAAPVQDFVLTRIDLSAQATHTVTPSAPTITVCTEGSATLVGNNTTFTMKPGDGVYIPAQAHDVELTTSEGVTLFMACQPRTRSKNT